MPARTVSTREAGKLRARKVCFRCNKRKIKCDLQSVSTGTCTTCLEAGADCELRPSNKGRRPKTRATEAIALSDEHVSQRGLTTQYLAAAESEQDEPTREWAYRRPIPGASRFDRLFECGVECGTEHFFQSCYAFCPIVDRVSLDTSDTWWDSPLLQHIFVLLARKGRSNQMLPQQDDLEHYTRTLFCSSLAELRDLRTLVRAAVLMSWTGSGRTAHTATNSTSWYIGVATRLAQEAGWYHDTKSHPHMQSMRRRIWWTLFVSESSLREMLF